MLVDYIGNTGFLLTLKSGERIALDWWMATPAFHGAWSLYPPLSKARREDYLINKRPDFVYVSHLHSDHLDPAVMRALDPATPVIVGKRAQPHLSRTLRSLGLRNILELEFEKEHALGTFSVVLFDDFSTDAEAPTDQVGYQLDSALLVRDQDGVSFLNLNDDVPSATQAARISQRFGAPDAAALSCSAASSYPQCFLNYNEQEMAEKYRFVVQRTADRFFTAMTGLRPRLAIPCGGVVLNGALAERSRFAQVQPDSDVLDSRRKELPEGSHLMLLQPQDRLDLRRDGQTVERCGEEPMPLDQAVSEAAAVQLDHERICVPESFRLLLPVMLRRARQRLWSQQQKLKLFPDWLVTLRVEPIGSIAEFDSLGPTRLSYTFDMASPEPEAADDGTRQRVEFVLDARLLLMVLISGTVWNNIYTSSLVQTRREPDQHDMNVTKLMSYFAV